MDSFPKKPCKHCQGMNHFPYACYHNPKNKEKANKGISPNKKHQKEWDLARKTWIKKNPPPIAGTYWECYLNIHPECPKKINVYGLTLDHFVSRSRDPSKRLDLSNLRPCCWVCNGLKGSRSVEAIQKQYGVKLK